MAKTSNKRIARIRRKKHIRKVVQGTSARPRLCVFRSARHIYAQLIDDDQHRTLASASSLTTEGNGNRDGARAVGAALAAAAQEQNITSVVFDRNGFLYHGRVAALADAAREAGLNF
jgi:large subunit ribosomal protein L18